MQISWFSGSSHQADTSTGDDQPISCHQASHTTTSGAGHLSAGGELEMQGCGPGLASAGVDGWALCATDGGTAYPTAHASSCGVRQLRVIARQLCARLELRSYVQGHTHTP